MRNKTCCFTGHRNIAPEDYPLMKKRLYEEIEKLILAGYTFFGAGGALGFDTEAALAVLNLKSIYPHIKLILILPCITQTRGWSKHDAEIYEDIKNRCDKYVYTSKDYVYGCMQRRNRHMIDHSSVCIAYMLKSRGGTAGTVGYAGVRDTCVINIAGNKMKM